MNFVPHVNQKLLAIPFLVLSFGLAPMSLMSVGDALAGIGSAIVGFFKAIADFFSAVANFLGGLGHSAGQDISHAASQTYSTTVKLASDARSYVTASIEHAFQFDNPVQSVNVTFTIYNVASMHFHSLEVTFHIAGKTISVPVTNPVIGPNVVVDSGVIILPSPLSPLVGITVELTGTLCGTSCSNLTFSPAADLTASVPPAAN